MVVFNKTFLASKQAVKDVDEGFSTNKKAMDKTINMEEEENVGIGDEDNEAEAEYEEEEEEIDDYTEHAVNNAKEGKLSQLILNHISSPFLRHEGLEIFAYFTTIDNNQEENLKAFLESQRRISMLKPVTNEKEVRLVEIEGTNGKSK